MGKRILVALSHAIEEFQQLDLLHSLGYEVASLGAYIDPAHPHVDIRPPLPQVPKVPEVIAASEATKYLGEEPQENIPAAILDWLGDDGIIIYHHFLGRLFKQWPRLNAWRKGGRGRRIIWRSVGQSVASWPQKRMMASCPL